MKLHKLCLAEVTKAQSHTEMGGVQKERGKVLQLHTSSRQTSKKEYFFYLLDIG